MAKPKGSKRRGTPAKARAPVGVTSGVGVNATWIQVFERNEQVDAKDRLTDEQISAYMKREFPDLETLLFDRVEIARSKYNRGGFHKKDKSGKPPRVKVHSRPHVPEGGGAAGARTPPPPPDTAPKGIPGAKYRKDFKSHKK